MASPRLWPQSSGGKHGQGRSNAAAAARRSKFAVKESQSLARVPDTLVFAFEFIMLPTPNEQAGDLEVLRRTILRLHPDLKARACCAAPCLDSCVGRVCGGLFRLAARGGGTQPCRPTCTRAADRRR